MKVVVASTIVPFLHGGGTLIVDWLEDALQERGHEVEVLRIPFPMDSRRTVSSMTGLRLLDLEGSGDRLVTIRYPSHVIRHPAKVVWFIHHQRAMFDLWNTRFQEMPSGPAADRYREMLVSADRVGMSEARAVFANSRIVRDRIRLFDDVDASVLYPPVWRPDRFRNEGYGDYLFMPSRLTRNKRQYLAIQAMRHVKTPVRLVIAGAPDLPGYDAELQVLVGDDERVSLISDWISESDKLDLLAGCLAVPYIPVQEDSYGYPSLEAHHAGKAVITTTDSGGVLELVVDGVNGRVLKPTAVALAECFDELWEDRALAARLGAAGAGRMAELGIDWDAVVDSLLR